MPETYTPTTDELRVVDAPFGYTANGRPIPGGFVGTVPDFLVWLNDNLCDGSVSIEGRTRDVNGRAVYLVNTVTGGFSDDEALLARVENSLFGITFWESTHRGGLTQYLVWDNEFTRSTDAMWLDPPRVDVRVKAWDDGASFAARHPGMSAEYVRDANPYRDVKKETDG